MERLTTINNDGWKYDDWDRGVSQSGKAIDRLAAYEDTGMNPEEITNMKSLLQGGEYKPSPEWIRLCEIAEADKDGRCVVLPCKVGDAGSWVHNGTMTPVKVHRIQINKRGMFIVLKSKVVHGAFPVEQIGKTVFLTNEPSGNN